MKQVLITNSALDQIGGTEAYVIDVARSMLNRGWQPIAFSTNLGSVAKALNAIGIPTVDNLNKLHRPPDLIHAHHHLDAIVAIQHFPEVPVVYFCHGWIPWQEKPLIHPQILHYVGVSQLCWERLVLETGISESRVSKLLSFVDTSRFVPKTDYPQRVVKALLFGNSISRKSIVTQSIQKACDSLEIKLSGIGIGLECQSATPERELTEYDIVFAKGRCALEALAAGCAVIVADDIGFAGLVTPRNFNEFRELNFGFRLLKRCPYPTVENVVAEIEAYAAEDQKTLTKWVHHEASLNSAMDQLEGTYEQVLEQAITAKFDSQACRQAVANYLLELANLTKHLHKLPKDLEVIRFQHSNLIAEHGRLTSKCHEINKCLDSLKAEKLRLLQSEENVRTKLQNEAVSQQVHIQSLVMKQHALENTIQELSDAFEKQRIKIETLKEQVGRLKDRNQQLAAERTKLQLRFKGLNRFLPSKFLKFIRK